MRTFVILICIMYFFSYAICGSENEILSKCGDGMIEFADCVKFKAIKFLDRVISNEKSIPLTSFLYLTHDGTSSVTNNSDTDFKNLKANSVHEKLNEVLLQKLEKFFAAKHLQIQFNYSNGNEIEGRKKKGKDKGHMSMIMGMGAIMMHGILTKIAFIAGKALIIAKVALILAIVIAFKKLMSHEEHSEATVVWKQAEPSGGGWHRSMDAEDQQVYHAHKAAYSAHLPED